MVRIQVFHNQECTFWRVAWKLLEDLIKEKRLDAQLAEMLVASDDEARRYRFAGSPQVMINGQDVDPEANRMTNFHASGCRPYFRNGEHYDYPPRAMVEEALQAVA